MWPKICQLMLPRSKPPIKHNLVSGKIQLCDSHLFAHQEAFSNAPDNNNDNVDE